MAKRQLRDELAARSLPEELKLDFERGRLAVEEAMQRIGESLQRLDPTLVEAATTRGQQNAVSSWAAGKTRGPGRVTARRNSYPACGAD